VDKDQYAASLVSTERTPRPGQPWVIGTPLPEETGIIAWMEEAFRKAVRDSKDKSRKT